MRRLSVRTTVAAAAGFTLAFVSTDLAERAGPGGTVTLPLEAALPIGPRDLALHTDVVATVRYEARAPGVAPAVHVAWAPKRSRAYPVFDGAFATEPLGEDRCVLSLTGRYEPPGGWLGAVFDALAGARIARATLASLVEEIGRAAERDYAERLDLGTR